MSYETCRKIKAFLLIALLAVTEADEIRRDVYIRSARRRLCKRTARAASGASVVGTSSCDGDLALEAMRADLNLQKQATNIVEHLNLVMSYPSLQKQRQMLTEQFAAMLIASDFEEKAERLVDQIERIMTQPDKQNRTIVLAENIAEIAGDSKLQSEAKQIGDAMIERVARLKLQEQATTQPKRNFKEQVKRDAQNVDSVIHDFQKQAISAMELLNAMMDCPNMRKQAKVVAEQLEALMTDTNARMQTSLLGKRMKSMMADPNFRQQAKRVANHIEGMRADLLFGDQAKNAQDPKDRLVHKLAERVAARVQSSMNKLGGRARKAPPPYHVDLDGTTLWKSTRLSNNVEEATSPSQDDSVAERRSGFGMRIQKRSKGVEVFSPFGKSEIVDMPSSAGIDISPGHREHREIMLVIRSSVWINFCLLLVKLYAFITSRSLAVLASVVDSSIDLIGQAVVMYTKQLQSRGRLEQYPVGRNRLEPLGVMVCAVVMGMASMLVIETSITKLIRFWGRDDTPVLTMTLGVVSLLIGVIVLKGALYIWCLIVVRRHSSEAVQAIATDNLNDVLSNLVALLAPGAATKLGPQFWMLDPIAACLISVYIIYTWLKTGFEQVDMIVGKRADADFLQKVQNLAEEHGSNMKLDKLCAYHFGPRYLVELEMIMPKTTTLVESHDAGITLQHKIETLEQVERCFVHIDYHHRELDDHDPLVPIEEKVDNDFP